MNFNHIRRAQNYLDEIEDTQIPEKLNVMREFTDFISSDDFCQLIDRESDFITVAITKFSSIKSELRTNHLFQNYPNQSHSLTQSLTNALDKLETIRNST